MSRHTPTIKYAWLQGSFWMSYCIVYNYAAVYLLSKGYSTSAAGMIIALASMLSAVLQPIIAGIADRSANITLHRLLLILAALMLLCAGILTIPGLHFLWHALFYGCMLAVIQVLTPLVNTVGMDSINHGIAVNFGLARGVGSVLFAFASIVTGTLIERYTAGIIPALILFCYVFFCMAVCMFRFRRDAAHKDSGTPKPETTQAGAFFVTYKRFMMLLFGISLLFVCHIMLNNYMFQIMTYHGGGSREMGIAAGFCAVLELPTMAAFSVIVRKVSSGSLLKISGIFFLVKAVLTFLAAGISGVYLAQTAQIFGFALFIPASVYYTNSVIGPSDRARGQAFMTATNTIGSVFGSLLGGFLIDGSGVPAMLTAAVLIAAFGAAFVFFSAEKCRDRL